MKYVRLIYHVNRYPNILTIHNYHKKEADLSKVRQEHKYLAITELHDEIGFTISLLCNVTGVQQSSYYKWIKRIPP